MKMINFAANFGNMRKDITNVVFDFGGVIAPADLGVVIGKFRNLGVKDIEKYLNLVCQQGFFGDFETGLIGEEEFRRRVGEEAGREVTMDECRQAYMVFFLDSAGTEPGTFPQAPLRGLPALAVVQHQSVCGGVVSEQGV